MFRNKHFKILSALILVTAVSLGFYFSSDDDHSSTVSGLNSQLYSAPVISNNLQGDAVGSWTQGTVVLTVGLGGFGFTYTRNDTAWLYHMGGDMTYGGVLTSANGRYNVNTNTWAAMAPIPTNLQYGGAARLKDSLYTIGGMITSFFADETAICRRYHIATNTWSTIASLPTTRAGNRAVGYQDSLIYSVGGFTAGGSTADATVLLYNVFSNTWRTCTPLPLARCIGACTIKGDTIIYVGGGTTYFAGYNQVTYKGLISQADRSVITWTTGANYPGTSGWRYDAALWGCRGVILSGGSPNTFGSSTECYVYSPGLNTWSAQANIPQIVGSPSSGSVSYNNAVWKLIVASGEQYPSTPYVINNTQIFTDTLCLNLFALCEQFVAVTYPPTGWNIVIVSGSNTIYWTRHVVSGYGQGVGSSKYDMWNGASGNYQALNTVNTLPSGFGDSLRFDIAYTPFPSSPPFAQDSLVILASTNGGTTYTSLVRWGPTQMQTAPYQADFVPTPSQWQKRSIGLPIGTNKVQFLGKSDFGNNLYIDTTCVGQLVGIRPNGQISSNYSLNQNYPNPFNPVTKISYSLAKAGDVKLVVFDILGREVRTLVNEFKQSGAYDVEFNASDLSSGIYFYKIESGGFIDTKKMVILK